MANGRGAEEAIAFPQIGYVGFPLSVSETFQQRNTNKSIAQAFGEVETIQNGCVRAGKELVVYLSMGFGNPYGDPYSSELVSAFSDRLVRAGVRRIDGALRGFGGCPMAADDLTGNLPTEDIIQTLAQEGVPVSINQEAFQKAMTLSAGVF